MFSRLINPYRRRLSFRLTVNYTLLLLCLFVLVCGFFLSRLNSKLLKDIDRLLYDEARELTQEISADEEISTVCSRFADTVSRRKHYPLYFRLLDARGVELYSVAAVIKKKADAQLVYPALRPKSKSFYTFSVPGRPPFRCYQETFSANGRAEEYLLQIITPTKSARKTVQQMQKTMLLALPLLLVLSLLIGHSASRRPFVIMRHMNAVTRRINAENMQERLPVPDVESEVRELTETINDMLDRLEATFNEVRQFTADVAHELRNPLCAVQGEMQVVLSRERPAEEYRETLAETLVRINTLIKIVNDLFLISRFDNQKVVLEKEPIDFADLVRDLYEFFEPVAREKQVAFTIKTCEHANAVVDRTHMQQLVSNLVDNALKFTPAGESVTLHLEERFDALLLHIEDTGVGISAEDLPHIFQRFYQADKTRSGMQGGSGLGLQICKRIAEAHGGAITVCAHEHKGVTFTLRIPRVPHQTGMREEPV
jgi:heavy metal sensor kinase